MQNNSKNQWLIKTIKLGMLSVSIISIVLCIIGIFLMSCDNQQKETEIISSIDYDYVGQYHNIGLNELLGKLNKTRS